MLMYTCFKVQIIVFDIKLLSSNYKYILVVIVFEDIDDVLAMIERISLCYILYILFNNL